jgi:hypothetical protein
MCAANVAANGAGRARVRRPAAVFGSRLSRARASSSETASTWSSDHKVSDPRVSEEMDRFMSYLAKER